MKVADMRNKSARELHEELLKRRKEQFGLRMQKASGQLGQSHLLTETRRDIARMKTVLAELAEKANG